MNVTEIITQTMTRVLNVSATDADNADTRARVLEGLTEVAGYVFTFRDWRFRRNVTTLSITSLGVTSLPIDFARVGDSGGVWDTATGCQLDAVTEQELVAMRTVPGLFTGTPIAYAVYIITDDVFSQQIHVNSDTAELTLSYETKLGILNETEAPDPDDGSGGLEHLGLIPPVWHQTVLMPGMRAMFRQQVGDGRYQDFRQDPAFRTGLREMVKWERHGDETTRSLPSFFGA